jgi:C_GCAxxG_C_C family probable redox protein
MTHEDAPGGAHAAASRATALYDEEYYCSEAVLKAACDLPAPAASDDCVRLATGFGAGIGGTETICGALCGSVMAVGLLAGRSTSGGPHRPAMDAARELLYRFELQHHTVSCGDIIAELGGMDAPGRHERCREVVGRCAAWVFEIAEREGWLAEGGRETIDGDPPSLWSWGGDQDEPEGSHA